MSYAVVMPTIAEAPFLPAALESVLGQSLPPARVLVIVNGPGAEQAPLVDEIRGSFGGVEVHTRPRPSMPAALAFGIADVQEPFVAFLDSDDLWAPDKQEQQVRRLVSSPDVDAVTSRAVNFRVSEDGRIREAEPLQARMFGAASFRRTAFDRFGPPDGSSSHFAWLYRWWSDAQEAGIVVDHLDSVGLRRRVHEGNGWVAGRDEGRQVLLRELRAIHRARHDARASAAVPPAGGR